MDKESLLTGTRWNILKQTAAGPQTAAEIARAAATSLPNVSQQIRLLEAYDFVQRNTQESRDRFAIKKDLCHLTLAEQGFAGKLFFHPNEHQQLLVRSFFIPNEDQMFLLKGLLMNDEILQKCSVAHVRKASDSIEILLLTEDVDDIRKKYSNFEVELQGTKMKVIAWTHNPLEINEGLERKDKHFEHLMKAPKVIHDPKNRFKEVRM